MKNIAIGLLIVLGVLLVVGYVGGSYYFADIIIDSPTQTLEQGEARMAETLDDVVLPAPEPATIPAGDVTLSGYFYENELAGDCAVLLLHGFTGTRFGTLQYAPLFWDRGCDLLAYDARGHGNSTDAYHTYGYYEKEDAKTAYDWLVGRTGLAPEQIGLTGVSYGAATSLQTAPLLPDSLAFIIADSPYQDVSTIIKFQANQRYPSWINLFMPGAFFFAEQRANFESAEVSPQIAVTQTDIPILLVHALEDAYTPPSHSETIYAQSDPATTELEITDWGAAHGMSIIVDYAAFAELTDEFLDEYAPDFGLNAGE